ncbi:MAG: hypothetical protein KIS67_05635 [Verrucomicrobiae bacterium]|nr:hypothetical protein [Verrucomicrobiae bacterium]
MNSSESEKCCSGRSLAIIAAVLIACLIFAALVWVTKKYTLPSTAVDEARKVERAKARAELTATEAEALKRVGWIDAGKGIVRLPIAEAMKLAEREWRNPAQARANLIARVEKATAPPPKPPEEPSPFE